MTPKTYLLTLRIPISALDDLECRRKAQEALAHLQIPDETAVKLQELRPQREPRNIVFKRK